MTDETEKPSRELTTQQSKQADKSPKNGIGGRLKAALDDMDWNGTPWDEAARKANLTVRSMRMSMHKVHVLQYLRTQRGIMLAQASVTNFHRLAELRDQDENRAAAVSAARTIEQMADDALGTAGGARGGGARSGYIIDLSEGPKPGLQIVIVQPERAQSRVIDDNDMIDVTPNKPSRH
jgi:hypothetical protein